MLVSLPPKTQFYTIIPRQYCIFLQSVSDVVDCHINEFSVCISISFQYACVSLRPNFSTYTPETKYSSFLCLTEMQQNLLTTSHI